MRAEYIAASNLIFRFRTRRGNEDRSQIAAVGGVRKDSKI